MHIKVFTLFPEMFPGSLGYSITGRALQEGKWSLDAVNIRDYAFDKHKSVDDTAFGGGPGMVMRADVLDAALHANYQDARPKALIYLSPRGVPLCQDRAKDLAKCPQIGLLCGRFEGVDQRLLDVWQFEEVSIGDYVLTGGEQAAMVLIDACVRLLPGVIGCEQSLDEESFSSGLLEYPQYTRPRVWKDLEVPEILASGHHEKIARWRREQAEQLTRQRRPDLWARYEERLQKKGNEQ